MSAHRDESQSDDEFLDRFFEQAVEALEDGRSLLPSETASARAHLRDEIERLAALAQSIVGSRPVGLPSLRDYSLIRELGRGGMGSVHLARQERLGRLVALKILPRAASLSARARGRFLSEARAIANLHHPNIVAIHDVIEEDGVLAYAMEWVEGCTLAEKIAQASLDPASVARLGVSVARALSVVHAAGLVHRDVKPSNLLLRRDGTPLLSDFGLVRATDSNDATQTGQFLGTLAYAAPEQLRGESDAIDGRCDVYALGATLYHALAGQPPFVAAGKRRALAANARSESARSTQPSSTPVLHHSPAAMLRRIEAGLALPLRRLDRAVPRDFETILAKAMEPDPRRRYASAGELADDLERMLALRPILARKASVVSRTFQLARRHRGVLAASVLGAAVALTLAVIAVVYTFFVPRWVDDHVRAARLALLHPDQANSLISVLWWEDSGTPRREQSPASHERLATALHEYDEALRLARFDRELRRERAVVAAVARGSTETWDDARSAGLNAFLTNDWQAAIEAWTRWERSRGPLTASDPLIDAALGVVFLSIDEPARAYLRLNDACRAFPDVGFLATYLADAALRCGDFARAEQLLEHARSLERQDPLGGFQRVHADLLAATGRDSEAEAAYRAIPASVLRGPGLAPFHFAKFLESRGRLSEALEWYGFVASRMPKAVRPAREFVRSMDAWWAKLSASARLACIRAVLDEERADPNSLTRRLALYERSHDLLGLGRRRSPNDPLRWAWSVFCSSSPIPAAFRQAFSSPSLQNVSLHELATRMEIRNMSHWGKLVSYPRIIREFHAASWSDARLRSLAIAAGNLADMGRRLQSQARFAGSILLGIAGVAGSPHTAFGDVLAFSDKATFLAATNAAPAHDPLPLMGSIPGDVLSTGSVTFSISPDATGLHSGYPTIDWTLLLTGPDIAISGPENLNIDLDAPVHSFGFDFVEPTIGGVPCGFTCAPCSDTTFEVTLKFGGAPMGIFQFNAPDDVAAFVGVWSDAPFDRVEIRDLSGDCEDEYFGQVYTGFVPLCTGSPVADAGIDQSLPELTLAVLDGSASSAPCGPATYAWTQLAGTTVTLDLTDPVHPKFLAPFVAMGGETLTFQLVVSDGSMSSAPESVDVTVTNVNHAPVAMADGPLAIAEGGVATLDGSNSYDDDNEVLTYSWQQIAGPAVMLSDDTSTMPSFTAPLVGFGGETLVFELVVSDGQDASSDLVFVEVENVNHLPVADAGLDQTRAEGVAVTLDAGGSDDADGDALAYSWTQVSGTAVTLAGASTAMPSFIAPLVGAMGDTLVFSVCVDDGYGGSDCDEVAITVQDGNAGPACGLARASATELWPPNHKLIPISILGVTDPENDAITITILGVTQDEPIDGLGDGDTSPDAVLQGSTVLIRAERAGAGNGRVYRVSFRAEDASGGACTGTVEVSVPKSKGRNASPAVDDGQAYDSTGQ